MANTSWKRLQDVFKRSWKTKSVTLKTSSRRLEDVLENKKCLLGYDIIFDYGRDGLYWWCSYPIHQQRSTPNWSTLVFYKQRFFSTQPQCCLAFSWIKFQILLRCCLIHITIIILRRILSLVRLSSRLGLGLLESYLCDLFFIFSLIFSVINQITSLKKARLMMLMAIMNCFSGMIEQQKVFSLISSRDHCQRSHQRKSLARREQDLNNLSSGFGEWSCAILTKICLCEWRCVVLYKNMEFLKYLQKFYFWIITQMKKANNFHVQRHAFAKRLLIFCQF